MRTSNMTTIGIGSLVAAIACTAGTSNAGFPTRPGPGGLDDAPDVTVSSVGPGIARWGSSAGLTAYSIASTSCNKGDAWAVWIDSGTFNDEHPVIPQHLYRIDADGRLNMIGASWVKHGFCAADSSFGENCGPCSSAGTCDWLGIGCTDTYGTGLNGSHTWLGPRSEINAFAGSYPFPFVSGRDRTGALDRRLQVHNDDLDPALNPGAEWYAEVYYVTTDEQVYGTQFNNASWRDVNVGSFTSGGWNLSTSGPTTDQESVVEMWARTTKGVTLDQQVMKADGSSDEGLFMVGSLVTDNGDGTWHYEYIVYNYNSDLSGAAFGVPVGAASITNMENDGVDSHTGEPYNNDAWDNSMGGGALNWETGAFALDGSANPITWGFVYNFSFDADAAPVDGSVTVGAWKDGSYTVTANVEVPGGAASCIGDLSGDGSTTTGDLTIFVGAFGTSLGDPGYIPAADLNGDDSITTSDLAVFLGDFGCGA